MNNPSVIIYTYKGHAVNLVLYAGVALVCYQTSGILRWFLSALVGLATCVELRYVWWRRTLPPGSSGYPILGHVPMLLPDPLPYALAETRRFQGKLRTMNIFGRPSVVCTSEEDAQWFLRQERQGRIVSSLLPQFRILVGSDAIMVQSGKYHQRLRRLFGPAFGPQATLSYLPVMDRLTQSAMQQWSNRNDFCEAREWALLAIRIFMVCSFGQVDEEVMVKLIDLFEKWASSMGVILPIAYPGSQLSKAIAFREELGEAIQEMVDLFVANHPPESKEARNSVMGLMVYSRDEDGNPPTNKQLIDNMRFIMFAGFDTMKASLSGLMHYFHRHRNVYSWLTEEVSNFSEPLDEAELKAAPILNAILAEMWRLNPPLHTHPAKCTADLKHKGHFIPKGTLISMAIQTYHHYQSTTYPHHDEFRIERWLPPGHPRHNPKLYTAIDYNTMSVHYRPFGLGAHMCLGAQFAKLEARVVLTRLAQQYDLTLGKETLRTFPLWQRLGEFKLSKRKDHMKGGKEQ